MVNNRTIQIRLTRDQYERIKNNSHIKGFSSLSAYLRYVGLEQDFVLHQRIQEIHTCLLGEQRKGRFKKNAAYQPFL
ncbi:MAG: hypothetical protein AB1798_22625 [Spirochaetota bacterium]